MTRITVKVDGSSFTDEVEPRTLLVLYLREQLGKTGTVVGCDTGNCGSCTVHLDGRSVKSCSLLAVQADRGIGSEDVTGRVDRALGHCGQGVLHFALQPVECPRRTTCLQHDIGV